jgi:hypothetical protein
MPSIRKKTYFYLLSALLILLTACGPAVALEETAQGGASPEQVVESFLEDLNAALNDPSLDDVEVRRGWAERLAGYFAPSERVDQRVALGEMLAGFVVNARRPVVGERMVMELTYTTVDELSRTEETALVEVVDGAFVLRWLNAEGEPLRERSGNIMEIIGQTSGGLPVLRVGAQWFLTEG